VLQALHLVTALLVLAQVVLAAVNALVYEGNPVLAEAAVQAHLSFGATILVLTVLRFVCRLSLGVPALPDDMPPAARRAAQAVHASLYLLLLALPLSGYVKLAALGYEVVLFGVLALPVLPFDPALASAARDLHAAAAVLLGILLTGHIAAAVFHRRVFGQPVLRRMFPRMFPTRRNHEPADPGLAVSDRIGW